LGSRPVKIAMQDEIAEAKRKSPGMNRDFFVNLLPDRITIREKKKSDSETVIWEMEKNVILS